MQKSSGKKTTPKAKQKPPKAAKTAAKKSAAPTKAPAATPPAAAPATGLRVDVRGKSFQVAPGRFDGFWARVSDGRWEPESFQLFDRFVDEKTTVIDFGAWIGPTVLYLAQISARTLAFEADPEAYALLAQNLSLNADKTWHDRIEAHHCGIHHSGQPITLGAHKQAGDSMSSVLMQGSDTTWQVPTRTLQDVIGAACGPDEKVFVKMDIEGGEFEMLPHLGPLLADPRITFYISMHPGILRQSLGEGPGSEQGFRDIIAPIIDVLPFSRSLERLDGHALNEAWLRKALGRGRLPTHDIIIF